MKQIYLWTLLFAAATSFAQQPIITTIVDGDCSGGNPKLLEIYADGTVDFANFSLENETNANTAFGNTFSLAGLGVVTDGFVYVTTTGSSDAIASEFPSLSGANIVTTGTMNLNGDDRVRIVDASSNVVDQYGVSGTDGSGESWEYVDSYAKRVDGTGPDGGFTESNWVIPGAGELNNEGTCQGGTAFETLIGGIGTYTTTVNTNPTINASGDVTGLDYFENNGPSAEDTFTVSGSNLTADIVITVPSTDFEISETPSGTFSQSITLAQNAGDVAATTIFVRLAAGLTSGSYVEDISIVSGGANAEQVSVAGTVSPDDPEIFFSGSIDNLTYNEGNGPSPEDAFQVSGRFLTDDAISLSVASPFEMALTSDGTYSTTLRIPVTDGSVEFADVFIRLEAGRVVGQYNSSVQATSNGASDDFLDVNGEVFAAATCTGVGSIIITEIMQNPSNNGDPVGEYFEVYNTTAAAIDLQSWVISDDINVAETHTISTSLVVPAGGYIVLGNGNTGANPGDATLDYSYDNDISLGNGTDGIVLSCGDNTIDAVIWDNGATFPDPSGASMELATSVLSSTTPAVDNDLGSNWGTATNDFGNGDLGTPGAANGFTLSNGSFDKVSFDIYPNPVSDDTISITTSNGAGVDVAVYSTLGQQVLKAENVLQTLNVSTLDAGIYLVRLTQGDNAQTRKLIVK